MKILITGAKGFVGRNLYETLKNIADGKDRTRNFAVDEIYAYDIDTPKEKLAEFCENADIVFHLAGVNRPKNEGEFMTGNYGFTADLLDALSAAGNKATVVITSSIQAALDNPYGVSKKAGEDLIFAYGKNNQVKTCVFRLPNVFGKWCRPNYNSAVTTFCHNIAHGLPITVNDPAHLMTLVYVDDVVEALIGVIEGKEVYDGDFCRVPIEHKATLGEITDMIYSFRDSRKNKIIPDMTDGSLAKKLYATYLTYLEPADFAYPLQMNVDERGSFTEILRTASAGQVSVNISKPGITKGKHWHHTKNEKFVVVSGRARINLRKIGCDDITSFEVSGDKIVVVDMIPGYTHSIENLSETDDLVTVMWCNECFDPNRPDTFFEEV